MTSRRIFLPLVCAAAAIFARAACAGESGSLHAGIAKADITPDPKMLNWTVAASTARGSQ